MDFHLGISGHEAGDHFSDLKIDHRCGTTDPHRALRFRPHAIDHFQRGVRLHHHRQTMAVELLADLGNGKLPGRALHQPHAKILLQQADAAAQP
ncbi:hypothetical protein D3C80_280880 [compost metagenome]